MPLPKEKEFRLLLETAFKERHQDESKYEVYLFLASKANDGLESEVSSVLIQPRETEAGCGRELRFDNDDSPTEWKARLTEFMNSFPYIPHSSPQAKQLY
jgi:hypothetical protein